MQANFDLYKKVQGIAKNVHEQLFSFIDAHSSEVKIADKAKELLSDLGITETWYHGVPALVLLGSRSCLSISGSEYKPSDEMVGNTNLVTVDLSPLLGEIWGDCARSYFIEGGVCTNTPSNPEFRQGKNIELSLHRSMMEIASPSMLFSELYEIGNQKIRDLGYENLDFLGNLGHSIETAPLKRRFIDKDCHESLGGVRFFTYEPHIRKINGNWGYKHENIYFFNERGRLVEL